jgi:hypothetical protein
MINQKIYLITILYISYNINTILTQNIRQPDLTISDCFTVSEVSGCLNIECSKKICKLDNFCCVINWDQLCVRNANYYCNYANKNLSKTDLTPQLNKLLNNTELINNNNVELINNNITDLINNNNITNLINNNISDLVNNNISDLVNNNISDLVNNNISDLVNNNISDLVINKTKSPKINNDNNINNGINNINNGIINILLIFIIYIL